MRDAYSDLQSEQYNTDTWIKQVRSGNPDAELAFNGCGHPILSLCTRGKMCPHQTFTSGENQDLKFVMDNKMLTPKNYPAPEWR